jgi:hypothetical protein
VRHRPSIILRTQLRIWCVRAAFCVSYGAGGSDSAARSQNSVSVSRMRACIVFGAAREPEIKRTFYAIVSSKVYFKRVSLSPPGFMPHIPRGPGRA